MAETANLESRLLRGAEVLGKMWADGFKCQARWAATCRCDPGNRFCTAKKRYVPLLEAAGRDLGDPKDPYAIIYAMKIVEVIATDLAFIVEIANIGRIEVGRGGQLSWQDLLEYSKRPEVNIGILQVLAKFPTSQVEAAHGKA